MNSVSVTYKETNIIDEKKNFSENGTFECKHYAYFDPLLIDINHDDKTAIFEVRFTSQLEGETMYYRLATLSTFQFDKFIVSEDKYEILSDYSKFSYLKHLELLKVKLRSDLYLKVQQQFEISRSDQGVLNSLESLLYGLLKYKPN